MNWPTEIKRNNIYSVQHQIGPKTGQNLVKTGKIRISKCETAFSVWPVLEFTKHRLGPAKLYSIQHRLVAIQRRLDTRLPSAVWAYWGGCWVVRGWVWEFSLAGLIWLIVQCGWAGTTFEVKWSFGKVLFGQRPQNPNKSKVWWTRDWRTNEAGCSCVARD